ncbi:hypothetical protein BN8_06455 [Fibrisoma limi BUZ 3]|uniref:DUF2127 domain-containing protein n=1 Tax=Fibrisoma limi BUZ 3 TaxID=1185876 RepID=I2GT27_9BACT|nr:hypothetical protein [Fibrisoma limi]CCH57056.1 hypothetical protein BN8_06455 [Fibrisoma limi BUZ 3]
MNSSNTLRKSLWVNAIFADLGAIAAFFLSGKWSVVDDLTNGQAVLFGVEMVVLAGLAAYAAWKPTISKSLVSLIIAFNSLLLIYLIVRFEDPAISALGMEVIAFDAVIVLALIIVQIRSLRAYSQAVKPTMVS